MGLVVVFLGKHAGRFVWRCRAGLMPVWWCIAFLVAGWVGSWWPLYWPIPISLGLVVASVLWFAGEKLSPHAQSMWLWLVPDGLDDGKAGVLDRATERGYLCLLMLGGGGWLSARMQYGWVQDVQLALLILLAALGVPWWWHRGFRRRKPLNVYVRKWKRVEQNEDLKVWHGSKITGTTTAANATLLVVKLRGGRTVKHVGGDALILCSQLGLRPGAITVAVDKAAARRVLVRVVPRDPWKGALPHPLPPVGSMLLSKTPKPTVGKYEDASDDMLKLGQHLLVVGATGSGKSVWLEALLAWILAYADARVVAADLASGATFGIWETVFAAPLATDVRSALELLRRVFGVIEYREGLLSRMKREGQLIDVLEPSPEMPWLFFIIDEFPDLIKAAKQASLDVITILERLANKGRKVGVWLILGAQNPTVTDVGSTELRGALTGIVGLGLSQQQSKTLWGSDRADGWDSTPLTIGTYLLRDRDAEHQTPRVAKGLYIPPRQRLDLIRAASSRRQPLDRQSALILEGNTPAVPLGETARTGAFEEVGMPEAAQPRLRVVREPASARGGNPPVLEAGIPTPADGGISRGAFAGILGHTRESRSAELDERVYAEVPDSRQGGIGGTDLATQLEVSRDRVKRSFARLEKAGRVRPHPRGDGTWCRT
jgi:hypothetical protein